MNTEAMERLVSELECVGANAHFAELTRNARAELDALKDAMRWRDPVKEPPELTGLYEMEMDGRREIRRGSSVRQFPERHSAMYRPKLPGPEPESSVDTPPAGE